MMATGTVKFFNSPVERAGMSNLNEGQKLSFDIEADRKNGKSAAANLQAI
jgi:CspA family cold shock protein